MCCETALTRGSLDSKKWVDPHTGLVPALIKDIRKALPRIPRATDDWLDYAINCIIHIERRNMVRTRDWLDKYGEIRRSASSEASQSTASSIKRKRSSTPMRAKTEDDDEPRKKLRALSLNPIPLIMISTCRQDNRQQTPVARRVYEHHTLLDSHACGCCLRPFESTDPNMPEIFCRSIRMLIVWLVLISR